MLPDEPTRSAAILNNPCCKNSVDDPTNFGLTSAVAQKIRWRKRATYVVVRVSRQGVCADVQRGRRSSGNLNGGARTLSFVFFGGEL